MKELTIPIKRARVWEKNPKEGTRRRDYQRLKSYIKKFGIIRRWLVCPDKEKRGSYIILGGNTRYQVVTREFPEIQEIDVNVVYPKSEKEMLEYALMDNDQVSDYDLQKVAELAYPFREELDLTAIRLNVGDTRSLKNVIEDYAPDIDRKEDPDYEFSPELYESYNYLVLYFENELDWKSAMDTFEVKRVKSWDSREGYMRTGIGRVLDGKKILKRLIGR